MRAIRQLLKKSGFYPAWKRLGHYPDYWYWKLRGEPLRSPHLVKQRTVQEYARRFGLQTLIETGTYYGEMVEAVRTLFARIYSIELDPVLYERARRRFAPYPHISILQGDSQTLLPRILQSITTPCLFWLDAGYYGWEDFKGNTGRLTAELDAILRHGVRGHVILMDDARALNGGNGAPTVEELGAFIERNFDGKSLEVARDILRIHDRSRP